MAQSIFKWSLSVCMSVSVSTVHVHVHVHQYCQVKEQIFGLKSYDFPSARLAASLDQHLWWRNLFRAQSYDFPPASLERRDQRWTHQETTLDAPRNNVWDASRRLDNVGAPRSNVGAPRSNVSAPRSNVGHTKKRRTTLEPHFWGGKRRYTFKDVCSRRAANFDDQT